MIDRINRTLNSMEQHPAAWGLLNSVEDQYLLLLELLHPEDTTVDLLVHRQYCRFLAKNGYQSNTPVSRQLDDTFESFTVLMDLLKRFRSSLG